MSNLADNIEFLAERANDTKNDFKPDLHIIPCSESASDPLDLLSPESPESRRPQLQLNEFDPKLQWQKVMKRLNMRLYEDLESSSNISVQQDYQYNDEDDVLPDTSEIDNQPATIEKREDENFFKKPFEESVIESATSTIDAVAGRRAKEAVKEYNDDIKKETEDQHGKAKKHWGKTLNKVRLIANLHNNQQKKPVASTVALVPYYPPLFDPVFLTSSTNRRGQSWPPVLLPFLNVEITDSELVTQGINQWVFRVELQYGDMKWIIHRTIAEFVSLHYTLKIKSRVHDASPSPPSFPSQLESWLNSAKGTIHRDTDEFKDEKHIIALKRRKALTLYLRELLVKFHSRANYDICEFLEISAVSINTDMGWKGKEGFLENKVNFVVTRVCQTFKPHTWNKRWVLLRDSYIAFIKDIARTDIYDVLLFDKSTQLMHSPQGIRGKYYHHIKIENRFRRIEMKGARRQIEEWRSDIHRVLKNSPWTKNHRFGSFAPIRQNAKLKWFVDGEDHFNAVGEALLSAKSEIYIADWWLSPELYLRRPPEKNQDFRLDRLLKRKAEEGVKIYIIVYKEMSVALTIHSAHTKLWLQSLHKNIIVVRHPDHRSIDNNVLFWSHHEKIVVVDNRLAFIGGLDLCWGRYDSQAHRLTDYPAEGHSDKIFPGQDYSNPRVKDFLNVARYNTTLVNRALTPRMPWHDMTVGMVGPIARDIARVFIQRWNFLKTSKGMHRPTVPFLMPKGEYVAARDECAFEGSCRVQSLRSAAQWSTGIEREHSIYNAYMECISQSKHFIYIENQFFISTTTEDRLLRNKIAQALVERIKRAHSKGEKFRVIILIPLIPAFEGDLATKDAASARNVMHFQYVTISRGGNSIQEKLREEGIDPDKYISWFSLRHWDKLRPPTKEKKDAFDIWDDDDRETYVSELIYIHDKIMIVDDRLVLIGSANINDRSQLGNRDSEIAMLIEDTDYVQSYMNGKPYKAAKFAHQLRMHLFKEHLGLLNFNDWERLLYDDIQRAVKNEDSQVDRQVIETHDALTEEDIQHMKSQKPDTILNNDKRSQQTEHTLDKAAKCLDPLSDHFYRDLWYGTAKKNTLIYRELFRCVPDDTVHTFEQHRKFLPDPAKVPHGHIANPELHGRDIRHKLSRVRGHLVQFPVDYLKDENMLGSYIRETVTPMVIFT